MRDWFKKTRDMERGDLLFPVVILLCAAGIAVFLSWYFQAYRQPHMAEEIVDLSQGWRYSAGGAEPAALETLRTGPRLRGGETMVLYRTLEEEVDGAALLIRANHQRVNVFLDGEPLYADRELPAGGNPGMALHFIALPEDYPGKTLTVELTSPYALYAGRTSPILLATIPTLEAHALSQSMRPVILMAMCLLIGFCIIALTFAQAVKGFPQPQNLAIGVFAVIWALYYVCTEYIAFQFFTPFWVSALSLGLYYTFQAPLVLFFYFSFRHYKKALLPAVVAHCGFGLAALLLQAFHILDLPRLVNVNNLLLAGLAYTAVLAVLEAKKGNRPMALAAPFLIIAYLSMLYNFYVFYARRGVVPYTYRDTYFLLLLCVLVYDIWHFFSRYYRAQREGELLLLQHKLATESYEEIKAHLREVSGLKHEMKHHIAALGAYLNDGRYDDARRYLEQYAGRTAEVTDAMVHQHFLINAVAASLQRAAEEQGVRVELNLKGEPVGVADPDLYSLLSNILDNALEACAGVPEGRPRFIRLTIGRREPYLHVTCENSHGGGILRADGKLRTTKRESGHGYGLWTVEKIAAAYGGFVDVEFDETTFLITAVLKDEEKNA